MQLFRKKLTPVFSGFAVLATPAFATLLTPPSLWGGSHVFFGIIYRKTEDPCFFRILHSRSLSCAKLQIPRAQIEWTALFRLGEETVC